MSPPKQNARVEVGPETQLNSTKAKSMTAKTTVQVDYTNKLLFVVVMKSCSWACLTI